MTEECPCHVCQELRTLKQLVKQMRSTQRLFVRTQRRDLLPEMRDLERRVDDLVRKAE